MNCKPGDIAVPIVQRGRLGGVIMEVLYLAPDEEFVLPNGIRAAGANPGRPAWVVRLINGAAPVSVKYTDGTFGTLMAVYGVAEDCKIRPLRDDPDAETRIEGREVTA